MKRCRTLKSFYQVQSSSESNPTEEIGQPHNSNPILNPDADDSNPTPDTVGTGASNNETEIQELQDNVVVDRNLIVADPGLRTPIEQLDVNIRDAVRREYVLLGPCQQQQANHTYPQTKIGNSNRSFQKSWFKKHKWLEYSVAKDAAFCFYCFLFKQPRAKNYDFECYTGEGFRYWKNATHSFDAHVGAVNSAHNNARRHYEAFKNQRQNVRHRIVTGTQKQDEMYLGRITIILGVVRFLLLQALPFRGHDESASSKNKGNFLEMIEWYKNKDANAKKLLDNAPGNNLMTSGKIQKHFSQCCAEETLNVIKSDIGDKNFTILIDEARDASIKEQMALVLRFVAAVPDFIFCFLCIFCKQNESIY